MSDGYRAPEAMDFKQIVALVVARSISLPSISAERYETLIDLHDLTAPFWDEEYLAFRKEMAKAPAKVQVYDYQSRWFQALIKLLHRRGFIGDVPDIERVDED